MHDMIVPLLALPPAEPALKQAERSGVRIRRGFTSDRPKTVAFVRRNWPEFAEAADCAFSYAPARIFVSQRHEDPVGFAAYDVDYLGLFGPTGVDPALQGLGIGTALLLRCLHAMSETGYLYAIIGAVGPTEFYARAAGAVSLPRDWPSYTERDQEIGGIQTP